MSAAMRVVTPLVCNHAWLVRLRNKCVKPRSIEWDKFVNTHLSHSRLWFNIHITATRSSTVSHKARHVSYNWEILLRTEIHEIHQISTLQMYTASSLYMSFLISPYLYFHFAWPNAHSRQNVPSFVPSRNSSTSSALGDVWRAGVTCNVIRDVQVLIQVDATMDEVCAPRNGRDSAAATTLPTLSPSTSAALNTSWKRLSFISRKYVIFITSPSELSQSHRLYDLELNISKSRRQNFHKIFEWVDLWTRNNGLNFWKTWKHCHRHRSSVNFRGGTKFLP